MMDVEEEIKLLRELLFKASDLLIKISIGYGIVLIGLMICVAYLLNR